jgi:hypothetical protein
MRGFFVSTGGRDAIVYHEGKRKMTITVMEGNGVYEETIGRWDDDPMQRLGDEDRKRIADNIRRAFESQSLSVYFLERLQ